MVSLNIPVPRPLDSFIGRAEEIQAVKTLLATKVVLPVLSPSLLPRPQLTARLNPATPARLALLVAPTGSGKSSLAGCPRGDETAAVVARLERFLEAMVEQRRHGSALEVRVLLAALHWQAGRREQAVAVTVKRHVFNLYGKLGANSRMSAVARARELGLL
jgi:hypothetical protein